jgi:hypothetical protein
MIDRPPRLSRADQRREDLFWEKVKRGAADECWPWTGFKKPSGHGLTSHQSLPMHASRKAWILTHGPIRGELSVNHRCDNAACCNPDHMYLGTRADNMVDRFGKAPAAERTSGRPTILTEAQLDVLWRMRKAGGTLQGCAEYFGVHRATICRYITAYRKKLLLKIRADRMSSVGTRSV